jgi:hypothetical protein
MKCLPNLNNCHHGSVSAPLYLQANAKLSSRSKIMNPESFRASRWANGNHLFPTVITMTKAMIRSSRARLSATGVS